ncbi:hypothetical protein Dimus_023771 [Dionaea muscipula]
MASSVVFKVKYGDTLRRFNVQVDGDQPLYLDMDGLRGKVRSLFNFSPDAALTMTYVDEDHDVVTLGDNEDLRDVVKQGLNPVRINVQLNDEKGGSPFARSSRSSTPRTPFEVQTSQTAIRDVVAEVLRSVPDAQLAINNGIADVLKSVPEQFREALSKVSRDVASKAASSSPVLADLIESLIKTGKAHAQNDGTDISVQGNASQKPKAPNEERDRENTNGSLEKLTPGGQDANKSANYVASSSSGVAASQKLIFEKKGKDISNGSADKSGGCSDSINVPRHDNSASFTPQVVDMNHDKNKFSDADGSSLSPFVSSPVMQCPFQGTPLASPPMVLPSQQLSYNPRATIFHRGVRCDGCGMFPITGPRFKSKVKEDYDLCLVCFSQGGAVNERDYMRIDFPAPPRNPWSTGGFETTNPTVWRRPSHGPPHHIPPFLKHAAMKKSMKPTRSEEQPVKKMEGHHRLRLDNRFIADVNVFDGTIIAPKTPFTKIWRMRNIGKDSWPRGTQLLWIGGDKFSDVDAVEMKLPLEGLPVDSELDVAVDFTAPELPGRYISYWRMASPSDQMFGQRVWVLIQVDASLKDLTFDNGLNLNFPPSFDSTHDDPLLPVAKVEPLVDVNNDPVNPLPSKEPEMPLLVDESELKVEEPNVSSEPLYSSFFPTEVAISMPHPVSTMNFPSPSTKAPSAFSYPLVSAEMISNVPTAIPPAVSYPPVDTVVQGNAPLIFPAVSFPPVDNASTAAAAAAAAPAVYYPSVNSPEAPAAVLDNVELDNVEDVRGNLKDSQYENYIEQILLKELEEMGFMQVDLNKEIIRMNKYNLERSVEDLCGYADSEWDPLLQELHEMGFLDKETNKRLLVKNNGSLKRVVIDLIAEETD